MTQLKKTLRALLDHPARRTFVITATCLTLLVGGWPAVDTYRGLTDEQAAIASSILQAEQDIARLPTLNQQKTALQDDLTALEARTITPEQTNSFQTSISHLAREHRCQVRRNQITGQRSRPWNQQDHPVQQTTLASDNQPTPYELTSQTLTFEADGTLADIQGLLADIQEPQRMIHTQRISLRRSNSRQNWVQLEVELALFDLHRVSGVPRQD